MLAPLSGKERIMALIVYGSTLSPFVRKVCVVLTEKRLEYTVEQVNPMSPTLEFLAASPLKKMPALRDTSIPEPNTLADSSVICDYIETKYPEPALYPKDAFQRARALWFEEYADTIMGTCIGRGLFYERVVKKIFGQVADESVCQKTLEAELPPVFDYLEKELGANQYYVGNAFSIADISVATMLANFVHVETFNAARWPHLDQFANRLHNRPSFKAIIESEVPIVKRFMAA
jgi:glutathione S-transferase